MASAFVLAVALLAGGCATTQVSPQQAYHGPKLAKPGRILVYPFVADASQLDPGSAASGDYASPSRPATPEEIRVGQELGQEVARRLVDEINDMGLRAVVGGTASPANVDDIVIRGHFASIEEGSAAKRMVVGFGSGKAELHTVVRGYVMTPGGLRQVGGGSVDSGGGKSPGLIVPLLVTAATANPIGLVVGGAVKVGQEVTGSDKVEGAARRTADQIAERLKDRFNRKGGSDAKPSPAAASRRARGLTSRAPCVSTKNPGEKET